MSELENIRLNDLPKDNAFRQAADKSNSVMVTIFAILLSIFGIVYGSMYIYESSLSKEDDTEVNYNLYVLSFPVLIFCLICITTGAVLFGKGKMLSWQFTLQCIFISIILLTCQIGIVNAIATPNTSEWGQIGTVLGSVLTATNVALFVWASFRIHKHIHP